MSRVLHARLKPCEKLAYLYLEAGQINRSVEIYEILSANNPNSEIYQQGLVNSYILGDMHEDAIALLDELTGIYPNRVQYREALATERFYLMSERVRNEMQDPEFESYSDSDIQDMLDQLNDINNIYQDIDETLPLRKNASSELPHFM